MDAPDDTRDFARTLRGRMSLPEMLLWKALKAKRLNGLAFRRQHPVGPYVLDFYCPQVVLCVEVDGSGHGFGGRWIKDEQRDAWLAANGIRTLRIPARVILKDVDDATRTILGFLEDHPL